ncbi:MAG: hypothetical protein ABI026_10535 [Gemmatimonadaceae bacterium]
MSKYIHRARVLLAAPAIALLTLSACSKKSDSLAQDSSLASDMQLANKDSAAQPQLSDVPAATTPTPAPAEAKPTPKPTRAPSRSTTPSRPTTPTKSTTASGNTVTRTPGGSETALGTIAAGTALAVTSDSRVCTNTNKIGDNITGTVANSVTGSNGATIPAGAKVHMTITELKRSENTNDKIQMGFRVESVSFGGHTYPVTASVTSATIDRVKNQPGSKDAQKVATGAAIGAVVGQIMGHSTKSTIIGAAVGAAGGAGAAAATSNYEGCVPTGGNISVKLDNSVQVHR